MHTRPPKFVRKMGGFLFPRLLHSPLHRLADRQFMVLDYTGRTSGRRYRFPVARHEVDGRTCAMTGQGWPRNFRQGGELELTLDGRRRRVQVTVVTDPDEVARIHLERIRELGPKATKSQLRLQIPDGRAPTMAEMRDAVVRYGLTVIYLDPEQP